MILGSISKSFVGVFQSACSCMKGSARRVFEAKAAIEFCGGSPRRAETIFGWNRKTIQRGLDELASGKPYSPSEERRGRLRAEAMNPKIVESTKSLIDDHSQTDPTFRSTLVYTRVTGQALRDALSETLQVPISKLPTSRTMRRILNRNGYSQKKVRKTLPQKKIRQTDAIFENVNAAHLRATQDPTILRISIDTKAKVKIGPFSRGGRTRREKELEAADHDMGPDAILVPCGILEVEEHYLTIGFGKKTTTSDMVIDNLEQWWESRKANHPNIKTLLIDLDNGPEVSSRRTQFMKRLVDFADKQGLAIELVYYPPYHSKYNRIERCWGSLEQHWSGTILRTIALTIQWAATMTWHGIKPMVWLLENEYQRGVRLTKKEFASIASRLKRTIGLEPWSVTIEPVPSS